MLILVLWEHVVFLCVGCTLFRMSLAMVVCHMLCTVSLMLHNIRCTTITRLILNIVRLTHRNTTRCHNIKANIKKAIH